MTRFSTFTAIFLTGAFATLLVNLHTPTDQPVIFRMDSNELDARTRQRVSSYECFKSTLLTALDLLEHEKISLAEARDKVYDIALRHNPDYLDHLEHSERGATPQERVAKNLVGHIASQAKHNPNLQCRADALKAEFDELQRSPQH